MVTGVGETEHYRIDLPANWARIPSEPGEQQAVVRALKAELAGRAGWSPKAERNLDLAVLQMNQNLQKAGAALAAGFAEVWPDGDDNMLVSASLVMGQMTRSDFGTALPLSLGTLMTAVTMMRPEDDDRVVNIANLEPPAVVGVGDHRAVRLRRHLSIRTTPGSTSGLYSEVYLVPHEVPHQVSDGMPRGARPESQADRVCCLAFGTPNEQLARDFSQLFSKMAGSFQLVAGQSAAVVTD